MFSCNVEGCENIAPDGNLCTEHKDCHGGPMPKRMSELTMKDLIDDEVVDLDEEGTSINCSDEFFWGSADAEDITEDTLAEFNKAVDDCGGEVLDGTASTLYCARRRKMRPQGAMYTYIDKEHWPLFDACGPVRDLELGNPYAPGDYKPENQKGK